MPVWAGAMSRRMLAHRLAALFHPTPVAAETVVDPDNFIRPFDTAERNPNNFADSLADDHADAFHSAYTAAQHAPHAHARTKCRAHPHAPAVDVANNDTGTISIPDAASDARTKCASVLAA